MSDQVRCRCGRCTIRGLMGPAVIVTVGVLFLLQQARGGFFEFGNTYPVILVVVGAILLASSLAPMDGHISTTNAASTGVPTAVPPSSIPPSSVSPSDASPSSMSNSMTGQGQ
jgi:hypothetical protein